MPEIRNLHELPRFRDGISYLYVERAVVEREAASIVVYKREGAFRVPAAALGVLLLGPGTRITHAAVRALAECGVTVLWVGEEGGRFYAAGLGETRSARRLYRQVRAWVRPRERLEVIKRLYRFRFDEELSEDLSLEELRGREGARVREAYARASRETGIPWRGRNYDRGCWEKADAVNRALSAGAAFLYGLCHAAIVSAGYSPALGFIHVGKQLSFVYDVADLYRTKVLVPAAFRTVAKSEENVERRIRHRLRDQVRESGMLKRIVDDLNRLFVGLGFRSPDEEAEEAFWAEDPAAPGAIWSPEGEVPAGVNYGGPEHGGNDS